MFTRWPPIWRRRLAVGAGILVALGGVGAGAYLADRLAGWRRGAAGSGAEHRHPRAAAGGRGGPRLPRLRDQEHHPRRRLRPCRGRRRRRPCRLPLDRGRRAPRRGQPRRGRRLARRARRGEPGGAAHPRPDPGHRQRRDPRLHRGRPGGARPRRLGQDRRKADLHDRIGDRSARLLAAQAVSGSNPAETAAEIDRLRQKLTGTSPRHILLASSEQPAFAMPAAAWAARSGDPVLFLKRRAAPKPTLDALRRHRGVPVYVLGPPSVISDKALEAVRKRRPEREADRRRADRSG